MNTNAKKLIVLAAGFLFGATASAGGKIDTTFHGGDFAGNSAILDNQYWPQPEGTTFTYRSVGKDGCEVDDVLVTDVTPLIDGVATRQLLDQVYEDDTCSGARDFLSESTLDWYAQDKLGNIWYFGEDTKSFCDPAKPSEVCSTLGSWKAGVNGAAPGIVMLTDPSPGDFYEQESATDAHDMAKVLRINADVTLTFDNQIDPDEYTGCLITKEWSPLEPGEIEHKFYCPGKGLLLNTEYHSGTVRTELVDVQP